MEFNQLIQQRFSVRSYSAKKVERKVLLEILDAARMAPSAVNFQPWHFIVIDESDQIAKFQEVYPRNWFREAPACIVVCADHEKSWKRKSDGKDFADVDVAIATDHLILKATEMGLGTCWVCNFDVELVRQFLNLPVQIEPLVIVPIGYSEAQPTVKTRKSLDEMVHWQKFGRK